MGFWRKVVLGSLTCAISLQAAWLLVRWRFDVEVPAWTKPLPEFVVGCLTCVPALMTAILYPFFVIYYLLWLVQEREIRPHVKAAWGLAIVLAGPVAMPLFFFIHGLRPPPVSS